jgi:hypothetical protein
LVLLVLVTVRGAAQQLDTIKYMIPDIVKAEITGYLKELPKDQRVFVVLDYARDTTSLLLSRYSLASPMDAKLSFLLRNSNRCLDVTPTRRLVVVLAPDLILSEAAIRLVNKGKSNEGVVTTTFGLSGQFIRYAGPYWKARIVQSAFFQY